MTNISRVPPNSPVGISTVLQVVFLILPVFLIYSNTFRSPFTLDDYANVVENRSIRLTDFTFENLVRAGFDSPMCTRPVAYISFALNYFTHEYTLPGYHLVNLLIHIVTGILLFLFIKDTLSISLARSQPDVKAYTHSVKWLPFFTAMIWLVHPLHTQSVTYIVQRMNSLAAMFYIAAIVLYVRARLGEKKTSKSILYACSLIAGTLALGSKEIALTLPLIVFLYEWFFLQQLNPGWLKKRIPLILGIILGLAFITFVYMGSNPIESLMATYKGRSFTLGQRVLTEFRVVAYYIGLLLFPYPGRLNLEYDFPISLSLINPVSTFFSLAFILGLLGIAVVTARKKRLIAFCILWFFLNLVIESSIIGLEIVFEHRTYLPSMFAVFLFVLVVYTYIPSNILRLAVFCILVTVFSKWTYDRNEVWQTEVGFLTDCLSKSPKKERIHHNLGNAYSKLGQHGKALFYYRQAVAINPNYSASQMDIGNELAALGKIDAAIQHYTGILHQFPDNVTLLSNLGNNLLRTKSVVEAKIYLHRALELDPQHPDANANMGLALSMQGEAKRAIWYYRKAIQAKPDYAQAYNNLGMLLAAQGEVPAAVAHISKAIKLNPNYDEAYNNLGVQLASEGKGPAAIFNFSKAITLRPEYAEAYCNLGIALFSQGKLDKAASNFKKALTLKPDFITAKKNFALVMDRRQQLERELVDLQAEIKLDPGSPELYSKLGDFYKRNGNPEAAVEPYRKAIEIDPTFTTALKQLAVLYAMQGNYDDSLALFKRIVRIQPESVDPYYKIASIYARQDKTGQAITWLEKAIERGYCDWDGIVVDKNMESIINIDAFAKLRNRYKSK